MIMHKLREDGNLFCSESLVPWLYCWWSSWRRDGLCRMSEKEMLHLDCLQTQRLETRCFTLTTCRCKGWRLGASAWPSAGVKDCEDSGLHHWKASNGKEMNILLTMTLRENLAHEQRECLSWKWIGICCLEQNITQRAQTRTYVSEKAVTEVRRFNTQSSRIPGEKVECQGICMWALFNNRLDVGSRTDGWGDKQKDPGQTYREMQGQRLYKII